MSTGPTKFQNIGLWSAGPRAFEGAAGQLAPACGRTYGNHPSDKADVCRLRSGGRTVLMLQDRLHAHMRFWPFRFTECTVALSAF